MHPLTRNVLRFALPPLYATLFFGIFGLINTLMHGGRIADLLLMLLLMAIYAYLFAALPSLLFAITMAKVQRRHNAPGFRLIIASLAGLLSGALIALVFRSAGAFTIFPPLGLATGLAVEATILFGERRRPPVAN